MRAPPAATPGDEWWCNSVKLEVDRDGFADVPVELCALARSIGFVPVGADASGNGLVDWAVRETAALQAARARGEAAADEARQARAGAAMISEPPK